MSKNARWVFVLGLEKEQIPFKKECAFVCLEGMRGTPKDFKVKAIGIDFDKIRFEVVLGNQKIKRVKYEITSIVVV